jgi:hypothetical protein
MISGDFRRLVDKTRRSCLSNVRVKFPTMSRSVRVINEAEANSSYLFDFDHILAASDGQLCEVREYDCERPPEVKRDPGKNLLETRSNW